MGALAALGVYRGYILILKSHRGENIQELSLHAFDTDLEIACLQVTNNTTVTCIHSIRHRCNL